MQAYTLIYCNFLKCQKYKVLSLKVHINIKTNVLLQAHITKSSNLFIDHPFIEALYNATSI